MIFRLFVLIPLALAYGTQTPDTGWVPVDEVRLIHIKRTSNRLDSEGKYPALRCLGKLCHKEDLLDLLICTKTPTTNLKCYAHNTDRKVVVLDVNCIYNYVKGRDMWAVDFCSADYTFETRAAVFNLFYTNRQQYLSMKDKLGECQNTVQLLKQFENCGLPTLEDLGMFLMPVLDLFGTIITVLGKVLSNIVLVPLAFMQIAIDNPVLLVIAIGIVFAQQCYEYIKKLAREYEIYVDPRELPGSAKPAGDDERACTICLENALDVMFVPCGHIVTCRDCAPKLQQHNYFPQCPICAKGIQSYKIAYLS